MATFKITVFQHQVRADGKYPVSIRVYWKRKYGYIGTEYYVTIHQIAKNKKKGTFELKDTVIIRELDKRIEIFEKAKAEKLSLRIHNYTASELARYFENLIENKKEDEIDFLSFGREYCKQETTNGKNVSRIITSLNSLDDFNKKGLPITQVTSGFLKEFEKYLRSERVITRKNQLGHDVVTKRPPMSDNGIADYMTDIRTIFNKALEKYNDDEKGEIIIFHYPFRKYKLPKRTDTEKRNLPPEDIKKIIEISDEKLFLRRTIFSRDIFVLSFLCVGMNLVDLYNIKSEEYKDGRFT